MVAFKLFPLSVLAVAATALPSLNLKSHIPASLLHPGQSSGVLPRQSQSCEYTCASTCYWGSDVTAALDKGSQLLAEDQTLGSDKYPHEYYDDEGFDFPVSGPWYEFPILNDYEVYSGGSPGADRVVFNQGGDLAGLITHTGSSDDGFTQCQGS